MFTQAKKELVNYFLEHQDTPNGLYQNGLYHQNQNQNDLAKQYYFKSLELDSLFEFPKVNLAHIYSNQNQVDSAIYYLTEVIESSPQYTAGFNSLGLLYAQKQDWSSAIHYLKQAYSLNYDLKTLCNLSLAYQNNNDLDNTQKHFLIGLKQDPKNVKFLNAIAIFYAQQEEWGLAKNFAENLLTLEPTNQSYR